MHRLQVLGLMAALSAAGCTCAPAPCVGAACPTFIGVVVSDASARGCEVLFTEQAGTTFASAKFEKGVVGTSLREAPRVALTFVAGGDAAIPADGVQLALTSGVASGMTVTKSSCVDVKGARLPNAVVSLR